MDSRKIIKIGGVALPTPSSIKISREDLDSEGIRPITTGILKRNRIRAAVVKIELSWLFVDSTILSTILNMIAAETFTVEYWDDRTASRVTGRFYAGPNSYTYVRLPNSIEGTNFAVNLVEV